MSPLDRSSPPASGVPRDFAFPAVERRTAAHDLDLRIGCMNRLPMVSVNLFMRAGEAALGSAAAGLGVLTADTLEGGTKKRSGSALAESLERIGARVGASGGWEGTSIGLSCLADRLPEAMAILAEMVFEPDFPEAEVSRAREQQLAQIRQRRMDPGALATDSARVRYFADGVPYRRAVDGSEESIAAVTREAMLGYVEANYRPEGGGMIIVGDVEPDEVVEMIGDHFGDWSGAPASRPDFVVEPATRDRRLVVVDRPGSVQSEVRIGHVGAARSTRDYYPLSIANMVLGGMFTSRLNLNLREDHGYTYGIRSRFTFRSEAGPFQIGTSVGNDVTAPAVREIIKELQLMADDGPRDEEVAAARDYAAGIFGLQLESAGQIATRITQLVVFGLPDDHFDRYRDTVRGVTTEQSAAAAARHMRPDEVQVIVAGDAEIITPELESLGLAPVEVVVAES
jgi:zinc protease